MRLKEEFIGLNPGGMDGAVVTVVKIGVSLTIDEEELFTLAESPR